MSDVKRRVLCKCTDIVDGGSKGFQIGSGTNVFECFVVRKGNKIYAYENNCPHTGGPLDWTPDRFIDKQTGHILCATHGALFQLETGRCLAGPCTGDWLRALPILIEGENIVLESKLLD